VMFRKSAHLYDAIYSSADYPRQAEKLRKLVADRHPGPRSLLDVACGTGLHLEQLRDHFELVEGLDLDPGMLEIAKRRLPEVVLHEADMRSFALDKKFDVVTCLFSSIGYAGSVENLNSAIATMAGHLNPKGLLFVEPWIFPEDWIDGHIGMDIADDPARKIARLNLSHREGRKTTLEFHYLAATLEGVEYLQEEHEAIMFTRDEYKSAFESAGLTVEFDEEGLIGRGLYIGSTQT
jgi:SAM-dependent methyltransferase